MAPNPKLTDAQRVVLAAAAARDSGLVLPLPKSFGTNRGTHGIVLNSLLTRALLVERAVRSGEEIWRETEGQTRTTLVISPEGLRAIGVDVDIPEAGSDRDNAEPALVSGGSSPAEHRTGNEKLPKPDSKLGVLVALLRRPTGASITELADATSWQAHSVRGAISGNLKKKLNLSVVSDLVEGRGRVYRIGTGEVAE